jgi:hypothetical protein
MKTLAVCLLFILSLLTLSEAPRAHALSQPGLQPLTARSQALPEGDDDKEGGGTDDDEDDEEEYRGVCWRAA